MRFEAAAIWTCSHKPGHFVTPYYRRPLIGAVMKGLPKDARPIPGFDGDYYITPDGEVWSTKWGGVRPKGASGDRVRLYRNGNLYRPNVSTLIRRAFGCRKAPVNDAALIQGAMKRYGDNPEVQAWAERCLA